MKRNISLLLILSLFLCFTVAPAFAETTVDPNTQPDSTQTPTQETTTPTEEPSTTPEQDEQTNPEQEKPKTTQPPATTDEEPTTETQEPTEETKEPTEEPKPKSQTPPAKTVGMTTKYEHIEEFIAVDANLTNVTQASGKWTVTYDGKTYPPKSGGKSYHNLFAHYTPKNNIPVTMKFTGTADGKQVSVSKSFTVVLPDVPIPEVGMTTKYEHIEEFIAIDASLTNIEHATGKWTVTYDGKTYPPKNGGKTYHNLFSHNTPKNNIPVTVKFTGTANGKQINLSRSFTVVLKDVPTPEVGMTTKYEHIEEFIAVDASLTNVEQASGKWTVKYDGKTYPPRNGGKKYHNLFLHNTPKNNIPVTLTFTGTADGKQVSVSRSFTVVLKDVPPTPQPSKVKLGVYGKVVNGKTVISAKLHNPKVAKGDWSLITTRHGKLYVNRVFAKRTGTTLTYTFAKPLPVGKYRVYVDFKGVADGKEIKKVGWLDVTVKQPTNVIVHPKTPPSLGGPLPKTATNLPMFTVAGCVLILAGGGMWLSRRRQS